MDTHARSDGARYERAAMRAYLRRKITSLEGQSGNHISAIQQTFRMILKWTVTRQQRYDKAPGGLGRTIRKR